jgi:hypothetical protein
MVKKALKVSLVPIYNAACMPLLFAKNTGFEHRQISLAAIAIRANLYMNTIFNKTADTVVCHLALLYRLLKEETGVIRNHIYDVIQS